MMWNLMSVLCLIISLHQLQSSYGTEETNQSKTCDIRIWHIGLMENLLVHANYARTPQQLLVLKKIDSLVEITTDETALMPCSLLKTYLSLILPDLDIGLTLPDSSETEEENGHQRQHDTNFSDPDSIESHIPVHSSENGESDSILSDGNPIKLVDDLFGNPSPDETKVINSNISKDGFYEDLNETPVFKEDDPTPSDTSDIFDLDHEEIPVFTADQIQQNVDLDIQKTPVFTAEQDFEEISGITPDQDQDIEQIAVTTTGQEIENDDPNTEELSISTANQDITNTYQDTEEIPVFTADQIIDNIENNDQDIKEIPVFKEDQIALANNDESNDKNAKEQSNTDGHVDSILRETPLANAVDRVPYCFRREEEKVSYFDNPYAKLEVVKVKVYEAGKMLRNAEESHTITIDIDRTNTNPDASTQLITENNGDSEIDLEREHSLSDEIDSVTETNQRNVITISSGKEKVFLNNILKTKSLHSSLKKEYFPCLCDDRLSVNKKSNSLICAYLHFFTSRCNKWDNKGNYLELKTKKEMLTSIKFKRTKKRFTSVGDYLLKHCKQLQDTYSNMSTILCYYTNMVLTMRCNKWPSSINNNIQFRQCNNTTSENYLASSCLEHNSNSISHIELQRTPMRFFYEKCSVFSVVPSQKCCARICQYMSYIFQDYTILDSDVKSVENVSLFEYVKLKLPNITTYKEKDSITSNDRKSNIFNDELNQLVSMHSLGENSDVSNRWIKHEEKIANPNDLIEMNIRESPLLGKGQFEKSNSNLNEPTDANLERSYQYSHIERLLEIKEHQHNTKIQNLELMIVKLENKLLSKSLEQAHDSHSLKTIENHILKIENEFIKLNQTYEQLQREYETLKSKQKIQVNTTPHRSNFLALADLSGSQLMIQQKAKISELSQLIYNHSRDFKELQTRHLLLEEQNQQLFQIVMNQSALISHVMSQLNEITENNIKERIKTQELDLKLQLLQEQELLNHRHIQNNKNEFLHRSRSRSRSKHNSETLHPGSSDQDSKSNNNCDFIFLTKILLILNPQKCIESLLKIVRLQKLLNVPCPSLCLYGKIIITNSVPFAILSWRRCEPIEGTFAFKAQITYLYSGKDHAYTKNVQNIHITDEISENDEFTKTFHNDDLDYNSENIETGVIGENTENIHEISILDTSQATNSNSNSDLVIFPAEDDEEDEIQDNVFYQNIPENAISQTEQNIYSDTPDTLKYERSTNEDIIIFAIEDDEDSVEEEIQLFNEKDIVKVKEGSKENEYENESDENHFNGDSEENRDDRAYVKMKEENPNQFEYDSKNFSQDHEKDNRLTKRVIEERKSDESVIIDVQNDDLYQNELESSNSEGRSHSKSNWKIKDIEEPEEDDSEKYNNNTNEIDININDSHGSRDGKRTIREHKEEKELEYDKDSSVKIEEVYHTSDVIGNEKMLSFEGDNDEEGVNGLHNIQSMFTNPSEESDSRNSETVTVRNENENGMKVGGSFKSTNQSKSLTEESLKDKDKITVSATISLKSTIEDEKNMESLEQIHDLKSKDLQKVISDTGTKNVKEKKRLKEQTKRLQEALQRPLLYKTKGNSPTDCQDVYKQGNVNSGVSNIFLQGLNANVSVMCDMQDSGWTVLLKREDGSLDFYKDFRQYSKGFGVPTGEHFLGNEVLHYLTNQKRYALKVALTNWDEQIAYALYTHFWVDHEDNGFRLHILGFSGTAGDGLGKHNGMKFSTHDVDNDSLKTEMGGSCARRFKGAGWYYRCYMSNLMGVYYKSATIPPKQFDGITWKPWLGPNYSLKKVVLSVRPIEDTYI